MQNTCVTSYFTLKVDSQDTLWGQKQIELIKLYLRSLFKIF